MGSISGCSAKAGFSKSETEGLLAKAKVLREQEGYKQAEASIQAVKDSMQTLETEKAEILDMVRAAMPEVVEGSVKPQAELKKPAKEKPKAAVKKKEDAKKSDYVSELESKYETTKDNKEPLHEAAQAIERVRGIEGSILANSIPKDFKEEGKTKLIGQSIYSSEDLAALAQIYRNPSFETLRIFFTKKGKVVGQTGVTSRLPGTSAVFVGQGKKGFSETIAIIRLREQIRNSGADGYYLLHNHPSGNPSPSNSDIRFTEMLADEIPGFRAHVVINHKKFARIYMSSLDTMESDIVDLAPTETPIRYKYDIDSPKVPHKLLGVRVNKPADIAYIGTQIDGSQSTFQLVGRKAQTGAVAGIMDVPIDALNRSPLRLAAEIRRFAKTSGSLDMFAVNIPDGEHKKAAEQAIKTGLLADVIYRDGSSYRSLSGISPYPKMSYGRPLTGMAVREKKAKTSENIGTFDPADPRILYSKKETTKPKSQSTTKQLTDTLLSGKYKGPVKKMIDQGKLKVVQSGKDLPAGIDPRGTGAVFANETVYIVADNVPASEAEAIMLHEGLHSRYRDLLGKTQADRLEKSFDRLSKLKTNADWIKKAKASVPADTPAEYVTEEIMAYAIEQFHVEPKSLPERIKRWVRDFLSKIKIGLIRMGMKPKDITPADLNAIAKSSLKMFAEAAPSGQKEVSLGDELRSAEDELQQLSNEYQSKMADKGDLSFSERKSDAELSAIKKRIDKAVTARDEVKSRIRKSGFDPSAVKTASDASMLDAFYSGQAKPFYSALTKAVRDIKQKIAPASQWKAMIAKLGQKGVKAEEIAWSGVNEWLGEQEGKVTRDDLVAYLKSQEVQVVEVEKDDADISKTMSDSDRNELRDRLKGEDYLGYSSLAEVLGAIKTHDDWVTRWDVSEEERLIELGNKYRDAIAKAGDRKTKYQKWQMTGDKKGYRELLLTMPPSPQKDLSFSDAVLQVKKGKAVEVRSEGSFIMGATTADQINAVKDEPGITFRAQDVPAEYKSGHYDEPNILAHIRLNERTINGKKTLFIEEIQSDWHQEGKKKGYGVKVKAHHAIDEGSFWDVRADSGVELAYVYKAQGFKTEQSAINEVNRRIAEGAFTVSSEAMKVVPDAPFKKTDAWSMLAFKRMTRYAAENGFEQISWTPGIVQAERYDLSKQVDSIGWYSNPDDTYNISYNKDGRSQEAKNYVQESELADLVGKDLADKIIKSAQDEVEGQFSGIDLKVGGEGMKGFYDQILPKAVGKFAKKFGAKVGTSEVTVKRGKPTDYADYDAWKSEPESKKVEVWTVPVTEEMRSSAMRGLPLFSKRKKKGDLSGYTKEEQEAIEVGGFGVRKKSSAKEAYEKLKDRFKTKMRQGIVDQYASIKEILKDDRAWMMAHLSHASTGGLEALMQFGQLKLTNGALDVDTNKKSLQEILEPLGGDLDRFFMWMVGNRAAKLKLEDRERLFSDVNIKALQGMDETSSVGKGVFESVRKDFEAMGDAVNKIAVETGLVSKKEADAWMEESFYVPFYRMLEGETRGPRMFADQLTKQTAYKKLKGSALQLDDPLTNVLMNWQHMLSASMKNQAAVQAIESAVKMGLAKVVPAKAKSKNAIWVRWDGKQVWVDIEEGTDGALVLDSLMSLNYDGMNNLAMKSLREFKRALTIGVTLSPEFRVANLLRDSIHSIAVVGDKGMSTNIAKNVLNGWRNTKKGSPLHARMIASGGAFGDSGYIHGADPEAIKQVVTKGVKRDTVLDTRFRITKMFDAYQDFGARMENVNRAAQFDKRLKDGDLLEAAFSSRDLLDFSRTGSFPAVRFLTSAVPFLNARLQGLDKMGRAAMTKGERARFATVVAVYSLASVALYLAMKDDEDYQESEEWEKDAYHLFKIPGSDVMYRLPRPFEVGAIANLAERAVEQVVDDDVHGELFAERLWHTIIHTFSFNPMPQAFMPALEVFANKNTFTGRPIESQSMENLPAADRKRVWTSETAIAMSKGMDDISWGKVVLSPVQIQHLVNGYLGWAGAQTLGAVDTLVTRPVIDAPERPAKKLTEYPLLKRFMRETPSRNTKYTTRFYEDMQEIRLAYNSVRQAKKLRELDKVVSLRKEHKQKLKWRKAYTSAQRQLSRLNRRIEYIHRSTKSPEQKRREIDRLIVKKNAITKRITKKADIR